MFLKNILRGTQFCLVAIASAAQESLASGVEGARNAWQVNGPRFDGLSRFLYFVR
jgi:hypothetical protein